MTVLSPSLPPVSCTTTRMVSFAPGLEASGAAKAVRARKLGTEAPAAIRVEARRKSRRLCMGRLLISPQRTRREDSREERKPRNTRKKERKVRGLGFPFVSFVYFVVPLL